MIGFYETFEEKKDILEMPGARSSDYDCRMGIISTIGRFVIV